MKKHSIISSTGGSQRSHDRVVARGPGGTPLQTGDVLLGADVRSLVVENGIIRVTYEPSVPLSELGALHLYRHYAKDGTYRRAVSQAYGDWTFFCSPFQNYADEIHVIVANENVFEASIIWTAHPLNTGHLPLGGVVCRMPHNNGVAYDGDLIPQIYTVVRFAKTIRVERGREGYFVGFHSYPRIGPARVPEWNNDNSQAERELGTGSGNAVFFSSAGLVAHHPAWGADPVWAGKYAIKRHAWARIDDPDYAFTAEADFIAAQNALFPGPPTFPNHQVEGPWWVADIPQANSDAEGDFPFCRYIALVERMEVGSWQFNVDQLGQTVVHFMNEASDISMTPHRFQCFIGAIPYVSPNLANEPTAALRNEVIARLPDRWPR